MDYKENIGKNAYFINENKFKKGLIIEGRETTILNTGSVMHGRLLDPIIHYKFDDNYMWYKIEDIFFSEEDVVKMLK
jgi:hypothetical protein